MFERWSPVDHELWSPSLPQPRKVLCLRVRGSIVPGAERGASGRQPSFLLGKADRGLKGRWPVPQAVPAPGATLPFYLCLLETT